MHFNSKLHLLGSRSLPICVSCSGYSFKTHCYFIARCSLH